MEKRVEVGHIYKHFKGHMYKVIAIATNSETLEKMVIYQNIDTLENWVREYNMFNSLVDKTKYPNVKQKYRFEEVNDGN